MHSPKAHRESQQHTRVRGEQKRSLEFLKKVSFIQKAEREGEERGGREKRENKIFHQTIHSPDGCKEAKSQEHYPGLSCGQQEPKHSSHLPVSSQTHLLGAGSKVDQ